MPSRDHYVRKMKDGSGLYILVWTVDASWTLCAVPRVYRKTTNRAGAERFAKKWKLGAID